MNIFQEYSNQLKQIEVEEVLDLIFFRPLAFVFVKSIYYTSITPNQLTIMAMVVGVFGGLLFLFNTKFSIILAGLFLIIYNILDCADGQLARVKRTGDTLGRIMDGFADYVVAIFVYLGIGFGFANSSEFPVTYWILIIVAALSNAAHSMILDFHRSRYLDYVHDRERILGEDLKALVIEYKKLRTRKGREFDKFLMWLYIKYSNLQLKFTSGYAKQGYRVYDRETFIRKNKWLVHLWTYVGPTTELSFLILCAFIGRLDIYLYGIVIFANIYVILLYLFQSKYN
jgi:phosphatidylglycerophosphate synthase